MGLKFNTDRPKISEEEIRKNQDFQKLVQKFKEQSIKQAKGDESWWKNKSVRYTTIIAGVTVVCTVTYFSLFKNQNQEQEHDKINTSQTLSQNTTGQVKTRPALNPPVSKNRPAYSSYKINNGKGGTIQHGKTKIRVPSNSFVDGGGKLIQGDVTIEYREMHNGADIINSGISMAYDSAGHKFQLETAGMFDIRGQQDGQQVYIAPKKELEVQLASQRREDKFNQYRYDTIAHNWIYLRRDKANPAEQAATVNLTPALQKLQHRIEVEIPRAADSVGMVYHKKVEKLPVPRQPAAPRKAADVRRTFKLDGSYEEFPELAGFNDVLFEVGPENTNYSPEFHKITWSDVKVSQGPAKGTNYILTLAYRNRTEKLVVYPVLTGKDLQKAQEQYDTRLAEYEKALDKKKADEKRLIAELESRQKAYFDEQNKLREKWEAEIKRQREQMVASQSADPDASQSQQAKATRIFRISSFGIYNSDCPHNVPAGEKVLPMFVNQADSKPVRPSRVYLVDLSNKCVYDLAAETGFNFRHDKGVEYALCVFQNDRVFFCDRHEFRKRIREGKVQFEAKELPEGADNYGDFRKLIEI